MNTAKQLLEKYLENIGSPEDVAGLFAEDGAIELPYLAAIGKNYRTQGPAAIETLIRGLLNIAPAFIFINIEYHIETPTQVFAEYHVDCLFNGKPYKQHYMGRLVAEGGKIRLLREAMDIIAVQKVMA